MAPIILFDNNPIVKRAKTLDPSVWTEVGFIPEDAYACKIYACNEGKGVILQGLHSKVYGCDKKTIEPVAIYPSYPTPKRPV